MTAQSPLAERDDPSPDRSDPKSHVRGSTKTPLFEANSADRYQRQALIKQIQADTGRSLICYVSGEECAIDANDTMPFVDLLHNVQCGRNLDLLLHTGGGSIDAAEKLVGMMRRHVGTAELRIIVPDFAKSAGTLMVLGADSVVMSDMSELGPIDPQIRLAGRWQSAENYLDAYRTHTKKLKDDRDNLAARIMLEKLEPEVLKLCETAGNRARQAAESLLKRGMFRNGGNWTLTAGELLDTGRWLSHGQMISWEDAQDPQIGS